MTNEHSMQSWEIETLDKPEGGPQNLGSRALSALVEVPKERQATIETDDPHLKALSKRYPNITDVEKLRKMPDGI